MRTPVTMAVLLLLPVLGGVRPCLAAAESAAESMAAQPAPGSVVAVTKDFNDAPLGEKKAAITYYSWSPEQKADAEEFGTEEIVGDSFDGSRCLKLTVTELMPWGRRGGYNFTSAGPAYLPPTVDAVRMRVKALKGKVLLTVGSPTVYFGHSDVLAGPQAIDAGDGSQWRTIEFSLNRSLSRNFRRARFGRNSPVIYYTRWIQEPMYLYVLEGSQGEVLIDQIEWIAKGEGRPYPTFAESEIQTVKPILDFEDPADMDQTFTFFQEPADFSGPPKLMRPSWPPPKMTRVEQGQRGKFSLLAEQKGAEEVCFAGVMVGGVEGANAIALTVKAEHPEPLDELAIDFVVYVTPPGETFPWKQFEPPAAWKNEPSIAFTYYLCREQTQNTTYAFYHVRRVVPKGQWTTLVLPLADFICAGAGGKAEPMFRQQLPLRSENIIAMGFLPPLRQAGGVTSVYVDDLALVKVPGTEAELRSFWQVPDVSQVKLVETAGQYGGVREATGD